MAFTLPYTPTTQDPAARHALIYHVSSCPDRAAPWLPSIEWEMLLWSELPDREYGPTEILCQTKLLLFLEVPVQLAARTQ